MHIHMKVASQDYHLGKQLIYLPSEKVHKSYLKSSPITDSLFLTQSGNPHLDCFQRTP